MISFLLKLPGMETITKVMTYGILTCCVVTAVDTIAIAAGAVEYPFAVWAVYQLHFMSRACNVMNVNW